MSAQLNEEQGELLGLSGTTGHSSKLTTTNFSETSIVLKKSSSRHHSVVRLADGQI